MEHGSGDGADGETSQCPANEADAAGEDSGNSTGKNAPFSAFTCGA